MSLVYLVIILLVAAIIIYFVYNRFKLLPMLKIGIVIIATVGLVMAQNITIPDDPFKPIIIPDLYKVIENDLLGIDPTMSGRDYASEDSQWQAMAMAFLYGDQFNFTANNTTIVLYA